MLLLLGYMGLGLVGAVSVAAIKDPVECLVELIRPTQSRLNRAFKTFRLLLFFAGIAALVAEPFKLAHFSRVKTAGAHLTIVSPSTRG